jgi:hypothetical protein
MTAPTDSTIALFVRIQRIRLARWGCTGARVRDLNEWSLPEDLQRKRCPLKEAVESIDQASLHEPATLAL